MQVPQKIRFYGVPFVESIILFFRFLGHLSYCIKELLASRISISRLSLFEVFYDSGSKLVLPVVIISSLTGVSLILNIDSSLSPYNLQRQVFLITQNIFFYDVLPFLVNIILSIQLAFHLVSVRTEGLQKTSQDTIITHIIPLLIGVNFCAIFLYLYALSAVFVGIFLCFRYLIQTDLHSYFLQLTNTITSYSIVYSVFKTMFFCTLVSIIASYYHYAVAEGNLSLRVAISRTMTRSFVALTCSCIYFKFLEY